MKRNMKKTIALGVGAGIAAGAIFGGVELFGSKDSVSCAAYAPDARDFDKIVNGPRSDYSLIFSEVGAAIVRCAQGLGDKVDGGVSSGGASLDITTQSGAQISMGVDWRGSVGGSDFASRITEVEISTFPSWQQHGGINDGIGVYGIAFSREDPSKPATMNWSDGASPQRILQIAPDQLGNMYLDNHDTGPLIADPTSPEVVACAELQLGEAAAGAMSIQSASGNAETIPLLERGPDTSGSCMFE